MGLTGCQEAINEKSKWTSHQISEEREQIQSDSGTNLGLITFGKYYCYTTITILFLHAPFFAHISVFACLHVSVKELK